VNLRNKTIALAVNETEPKRRQAQAVIRSYINSNKHKSTTMLPLTSRRIPMFAAMAMVLIMTVINGIPSTEAAGNINPTLPFGDINILAISDAHSFVGGHPHEVRR
jgi:hypothetical protein